MTLGGRRESHLSKKGTGSEDDGSVELQHMFSLCLRGGKREGPCRHGVVARRPFQKKIK